MSKFMIEFIRTQPERCVAFKSLVSLDITPDDDVFIICKGDPAIRSLIKFGDFDEIRISKTS